MHSSVSLRIIDLSNEASALSLQQVAGGKTIAAVALWSSHDILLFDLPDLSQTATISAASSIVIRSIQIATFASDQTLLFAGLGDGTLLSYALDPQAATVVDSSRKAVALGSRPIVMTPYCYDDEMAILASSDQPTLITRRNGRTNYASINLKASPFPSGHSLA